MFGCAAYAAINSSAGYSHLVSGGRATALNVDLLFDVLAGTRDETSIVETLDDCLSDSLYVALVPWL